MAICDNPSDVDTAIEKVWSGLVEVVSKYDPGVRSHLIDWSKKELAKIPEPPGNANLYGLPPADQLPTGEQKAMRSILLSLQETLSKG